MILTQKFFIFVFIIILIYFILKLKKEREKINEYERKLLIIKQEMARNKVSIKEIKNAPIGTLMIEDIDRKELSVKENQREIARCYR